MVNIYVFYSHVLFLNMCKILWKKKVCQSLSHETKPQTSKGAQNPTAIPQKQTKKKTNMKTNKQTKNYHKQKTLTKLIYLLQTLGKNC